MTITIFVEPSCLSTFVQITQILKLLNIENNYVFTPSDIRYSETFASNYVQIGMEIGEYYKLRYCINKLSK